MFKPALDEKSRQIAQKQINDIEKELGKDKLNLSSYMDILIKKGEIYKDRIR